MRTQAPSFLLLTLLTISAAAQHTNPQPISCAQFIAWTAGGMSSQRLDRLARERGLAFPLNVATSNALLEAGVERTLLQTMRSITPGAGTSEAITANAITANAISSNDGTVADCPAPAVRAGALVQQKKYREAQSILQKLIAADPNNPALHFAIGYVHQQQDDWDEASDSYETARALMPGLSDIHSRLAYLLYRSEDSDGAIAEARTALSIDPGNAEAYRFLGLGFYASRQYQAAVHAFRESLTRQPSNADAYYDLAMTLRDQGDVDAAAAAYRKAISGSGSI